MAIGGLGIASKGAKGIEVLHYMVGHTVIDMTASGTASVTNELAQKFLPPEVARLISSGVSLALAMKMSKRYDASWSAGYGMLDDMIDTVRGIDKADDFSKGIGGVSAFGDMSPSDAARYNQYWDDVANGIDTNDRVKLNQWQYRPSAELYNKYQNVYDNPEYFNQSTGSTIYPEANGFVDGVYENEVIQPGEIIDRYGSNGTGQYFSPGGTSFEERALPPFMEEQPYTKYEVIRQIPVKSGETATWFDQPGGGTQYLTDMTVDELILNGYIRELK